MLVTALLCAGVFHYAEMYWCAGMYVVCIRCDVDLVRGHLGGWRNSIVCSHFGRPVHNAMSRVRRVDTGHSSLALNLGLLRKTVHNGSKNWKIVHKTRICRRCMSMAEWVN